MPRKKSTSKLETNKTRAADRLGVTVRTVTTWQKEPGFPDYSSGYDIAKIKKWAEGRGKKNSQHDDHMRRLEEQSKQERLRIDQLKAEKLEREKQLADGNYLHRDEYEAFAAEQITVARDRLLLIPRELCKFLPKKYHKIVVLEGNKTIEKILRQLSRKLEEGPDN